MIDYLIWHEGYYLITSCLAVRASLQAVLYISMVLLSSNFSLLISSSISSCWPFLLRKVSCFHGRQQSDDVTCNIEKDWKLKLTTKTNYHGNILAYRTKTVLRERRMSPKIIWGHPTIEAHFRRQSGCSRNSEIIMCRRKQLVVVVDLTGSTIAHKWYIILDHLIIRVRFDIPWSRKRRSACI